MSSFRNRPLKVLDAIYNFIGGMVQSGEVGLAGPISLVHDVSRESETWGMGPREGYWVMQGNQSHSGSGEIAETVDPYVAVNVDNGYPTPLDPNLRVWIIDVWGSILANPGGLVQMEVTITYPARMVGPSDTGSYAIPEQGIWHANTVSVINGGTNSLVWMAGAPMYLAKLPIEVHPNRAPNTTIGIRSEASAAVTTRFNILLWVGRQGTRPPGLY